MISPFEEKERLKELDSYNIFDTVPDKFLDEIVELASIVLKAPISMISLIDEDRQWYKAAKGIESTETERKNSFCQHSFSNPHEVFTVSNALEDSRFTDNPLVLGDPNLRFYAGAPLETPNGHVLGTLCVIDTKPRTISEKQKRALKILAKQAMDHLNVRKRFYLSDQDIYTYSKEVMNLTDEIPGVLYQFRMNSKYEMSFDFFSEGVYKMLPGIKTEELKDVSLLMSKYIHQDDIPALLSAIQTSYENITTWEAEFRVLRNDGTFKWYIGKAQPEQRDNASVVWCGFFHNITRYKEYEAKLKQITFDISHVIRKPVTTLLGLMSLFEENHLSKNDVNECLGYIKYASQELDDLTSRLDKTYRQNIQLSADS